MDRKKRRRSVRNLRRQSIISCAGENDEEAVVIDDILALTLNGTVERDDSMFGTVWVDTQGESLKEKRKKRRSSMLFQKPLLNFDTTALEVETLRADITEKSPTLVTVSPDFIKCMTNNQPSPLITPNQSFKTMSPNNLDVAFVLDNFTPVFGLLNTSAKKIYPVTPDVDSFMLDETTPNLSTSNLYSSVTCRKVYPVTPDVEYDILGETTPGLSTSKQTSPNFTYRKVYPVTPDVDDILSDSPQPNYSPFLTPLTSKKNENKDNSYLNHAELTPSYNNNCSSQFDESAKAPDVFNNAYETIDFDNKIDSSLTNICENASISKQIESGNQYFLSDGKLVSGLTPHTSSNSSNNHTNPSPLLLQSINCKPEEEPQQNELTPSQPFDNPDKSDSLDDTSSKSTTVDHSESNIVKLISPTSIAESLDNIATGAMGLFNTLVRKISIKRGKSQKKTPKRLKSDKNSESSNHNEHTEKIRQKFSLQKDPTSTVSAVITNDTSCSTTKQTTVNIECKEVNNEEDFTLQQKKPSTSNIAVQLPVTTDSVEMEDYNLDNFNMTSLVESIDSQKENLMKAKRQSRRRSAEYYITNNSATCMEEGNESIDDKSGEKSSLRKSQRKRRASLDIYQSGMENQPNEPLASILISQFVKFSRPRKPVHENLEDLYMNKNYKAPQEKTWETIYESPGKTKQPNQLMSKKRSRRVIDFDGFAPAKFKRRLQRASNNGWDVTGKKNKFLTDDFVRNKLSDLYVYLDSSLET